MSKGKVKYFNEMKGWGFISNTEDEKDIFVHYKDIDMDGFKTLKEGQDVVFEMVTTGKGLRAQNVKFPE